MQAAAATDSRPSRGTSASSWIQWTRRSPAAKSLGPLRLALLLWLLTSVLSMSAQTNSSSPAVSLPAKSKFHLYLLIGQSNMAGRGKVGRPDKTPHPRVLTFTPADTWAPAVEPITHDKPTMLGVGPGLAFGKAMAEKYPDVTIGLVPCAFGGTPLRRWQRGGDLYSNAVHRVRLAMQDGSLKGILWHQGESDSGAATNANTYADRLGGMIRDLRADLGAPNLPFVAGELGEFFYGRTTNASPYVMVVNDALKNLPQTVRHSACASSKGLKDNGDTLHFNAAAQREFGQRYAEQMILLLASP
jgi:hypothetical protein